MKMPIIGILAFISRINFMLHSFIHGWKSLHPRDLVSIMLVMGCHIWASRQENVTVTCQYQLHSLISVFFIHSFVVMVANSCHSPCS